ncbi:uncharacterized protein [Anabrus simplex]|uniref:uncharacterized protein isoform X2 n=1 Tax=Anabrus simplex TaxID=316456 RepID=UPI0035A33BDB
MEKEVVFTINDKLYRVDCRVPPDTTLNTYIRNYANLRGTKNMCHEGGCGACIVAATTNHPVTKNEFTQAVNSCLIPVFSCHGWAITTVEGIGNRNKGYHKIQKRLAQMNGSQCGYCTPGMVMNMYSLTADKDVTMWQVENSFGGNICRCTGYRPILDAFKSLAKDAPPELIRKCQDIEDLTKGMCPKNGMPCGRQPEIDELFGARTTILQRQQFESSSLRLPLDGAVWYRVNSLAEVFQIFSSIDDDTPYMLVGGNTGQGVYRRQVEPKVFIDIMGVEELKSYSTAPALTLGAQMSLTEVMELFYSLSAERPEFKYTKSLADHIDVIANVPVRNTGTMAGNLFMKHQVHDFPSDLFLMLESVGARITVASQEGTMANLTLAHFLTIDMKKKVIHSVTLPSLDDSYFVNSYKIMPRAQNAHAYVNAGFMFKLKKTYKGEVIEKPNIIYGGINAEFLHATKTEEFLTGKQLFDVRVLQRALDILDEELEPEAAITDSTPAYRKGLAKGLFYKYVLHIAPDNLKKTFQSGGVNIYQSRKLNTGKQEYDTDKSIWPLNKPIPKVEALIQCSGEALYVNDVPTIPNELFAAFVLTRVAQGNIAKIDPSPALSMPGVVQFLGVGDIPGKNEFAPPLLNLGHKEELFCSGKILYAGQPVGIIVAESQTVANRAANAVLLEYSDVKKPVLTVRDAVASGDASRVVIQAKHEPKTKVSKSAKHVIKGSWDIGSQYHYTMETQSCVCIPTEDGMDVYPATQWMDLTHIAIAEALAVPQNSVNLVVRRLGGGYGAKISRGTQVAVACALAAHSTNRPVRFVMMMEPNMESMGKRYACGLDYEVGFDDQGRICYLEAEILQNSGNNFNESVLTFTIEHFANCYDNSRWNVVGKACRTDITGNTYCRAPGSLEGVAFIEHIMEHMGRVLKVDPLQVRMANMSTTDNAIPELIGDVRKWADYDKRKADIDAFNKNNRWKKRGIAMVPMKYPFFLLGGFHATVSIYSVDGTVSVSHGAIECGQGANTKVAQVVAHVLGIPLEMVSVKPANNFTSPNSMVTGLSLASESAAYAALACCQELNKRLEPVKKKMGQVPWKELIAEASKQVINLCANYMFTAQEVVSKYNIFGVTVAEVEIDLLTGQQMVLRVDILEDAGQSLSPEVDIGQVEGAFIMGLGYWLMEYLLYHPDSGELLTNRTWNYKPPGPKDIPVDFRVQLRRNAPNPAGVLRSKDSPASAETVFLTSLSSHKQYLL